MISNVQNRRKAFTGTSPLIDGLVAWWSLKETSGTRYDSHTNGLNLSDSGSVGYATVNGDNGADFSGSNYLYHGDDPLLDFTTGFSFSCWLNPDVWSNYNCIAQKGGWTTSSFMIYTTSDLANLRCLWNYSDITAWSDVTYISWTGSDKQVVFTYDGNGSTNADKSKIYIDGVSQSVTFVGTVPSSLLNRSGEFRLGSPNGGLTNYDGKIADAGLWNRALTPDEITLLYNDGVRIDYPFV